MKVIITPPTESLANSEQSLSLFCQCGEAGRRIQQTRYNSGKKMSEAGIKCSLLLYVK